MECVGVVRRFFFNRVPDRSARVLTACVLKNVVLRTTVITDCWAGYNRLSSVGFTHFRVNHSENFVHPEDPEIHTQTIEGLWGLLKGFFKNEGPKPNHQC